MDKIYENGIPNGKKLGIDYLRSEETQLVLKLPNDKSITLSQSGMGLIAISTVIWDAGLLLIDYLISLHNQLGDVLDLGCGTGICGIFSVLLNAKSCLFSDMIISECLLSNIEILDNNLSSNKCKTIQYNWNDRENIPECLLNRTFDIILCSDVLYDSKTHAPFISLIKKLSFNKLLLAYKIRHPEEERAVLTKLSELYTLNIIDNSSFPKFNIKECDLIGLYIFEITPI